MHSTQQEAGLGQFAVITGGAGGLGRAIAHRLARAGVVSAFWDIDAATAAAAALPGARAYAVHVTSYDSVKNATDAVVRARAAGSLKAHELATC